MTNKFYRRTGLFIYIIFKGKDAGYLIHDFGDIFGAALIPSPSGGSDVGYYGNALIVRYLSQLHIKAGVVNHD